MPFVVELLIDAVLGVLVAMALLLLMG